MAKIRLNKFDGGQAEDVRTFNTDECEYSKNFDLFTNPHKLIPYRDSVAEDVSGSGISTMDDADIADVDVGKIVSTYFIHGMGREGSSGSAKPAFYTKTAIGAVFSRQGATADGYTYVPGSGVSYKDRCFVLGFNLSDYRLYRYDGSGTVTTCGTISTTQPFYARPFVHPEDNILYIIIGNTITTWDDSAMATHTTILPTAREATAVCDYGAYLAIAMRPLRMAGTSFVYLWGRDVTLNTLQGVVDFGEGDIKILDNLDNALIGIMAPQSGLSTMITNKIRIKAWTGGAVDTVKSFTVGAVNTLITRSVKNGGKIYFGLNADDAVYAFGKNLSGQYIFTKDRYLFNGTTINSLSGLAMIGDYLWRAFTTVGAGLATLMRDTTSAEYVSTSVYRTTVNPSMPLEDRYMEKQLKSVRIVYTGAVTGVTNLKYIIDGGSAISIISDTNSAGERTTEATALADASSFGTFREIQFQVETTGGSQVKEVFYDYGPVPTQN